MATVSATQQIRTITPPSSSHGGAGSGSWNMENENPVYSDEKAYLAYDNRPPISQQLGNGNRKMSYSSDDYLAPRKSNTLGRKKSDVGNEAESEYSLEAYKVGAGSKSVPNGIDKNGKRKPSKAMLRTAEEDENNWIHRDKLAQIESRELEEAGFPVGRPSRTGSRSASHSRQEQNKEQDIEDEYVLKNDTKRQKMVSPIPAEDDEEDDEHAISFELRTPEEVAMEQEARQYFHTPTPANPKGTRLPMPKASPVPVPSVIMERDSPLPRSRTSSGNLIPDIRPRSRSMSSQVMLDDDIPRTPTHARGPSGSSDGSPPKSKVPSKTPASGARKGSTQRKASEASKSRNSSQQNRASPEKRPGTSSGRPSTSHRPEGDPPWIASMYKPDPRLPPDQQMLPTHAKRLAQERWEKEGKTGTMYDREFRLLNTDEIAVPEKEKSVPEPPKTLDPKKNEEWRKSGMTVNTGTTWPLGSPLGSPGSRPGTSGTEHGGYSTMPKIQSPQVPTTPVTAGKERVSQQPVRLQEPEEEYKEKKGCCCIVM